MKSGIRSPSEPLAPGRHHHLARQHARAAGEFERQQPIERCDPHHLDAILDRQREHLCDTSAGSPST